MAATATITGRTPLGKEIVDTLLRLAEAPDDPRAEDSDLFLWLRAARAAWLLGDLEQAYTCYRAVAPALLEQATSRAANYGMFGEFAALALGCGWMAVVCSPDGQSQRRRSADRRALETMTAIVERLGAQIATGIAGRGQRRQHSVVRMQAEMARLRAVWYGSVVGSADMIQDFQRQLQRLQQRVRALDAIPRALWTSSREAVTVAAYVAIQPDQPPDRILRPLLDLDAKLREGSALDEIKRGVTGPPTIGDLVDEELISIATAAEQRGVKVDALRLPVKAGARRREVL